MILPPSDILGYGPGQQAWYCVRAQPRRDHVAAANLRRYLSLDVFTPRIRFRRSTKRGLIWVTEPLFPNYVFARFERATELTNVQHTFGVAGVVHFGPFWPTVPTSAVEELRQAVGQEETRVVDHTLEVGEQIEVAAGPFQGFRAVVTRLMPARQRVAVLLEFLGKQTVVELDNSAVTTESAGSNDWATSAAVARLALK